MPVTGWVVIIPTTGKDDNIDDNAIWHSENPSSSILHLNMSDNGSVVVSESTSDHWTVTTLRAPLDAAHPVSGNRSWGYVVNPNGTYTFYVTGADRLTTEAHDLIQSLSGLAFNKADALWESYQKKITDFVNGNSGSASVGAMIKERPDYKYLKDYLDGKITLEQLKELKRCK